MNQKIKMQVKKDYKNLWMSPNIAIGRLEDLIKKYGLEKILVSNQVKHEREGWIGGVFFAWIKRK